MTAKFQMVLLARPGMVAGCQVWPPSVERATTPPLPGGLSPALLQRIRVDNPLETYPRLKETVA